jgi:hypothetical protein
VYEPNVQRILESLSPNDLVLDIGGWASPFNRANYILDVEPYETRGFYRTFGGPASQGPSHEHFTKDTWIQRDLCERTPFPFRDKQLDFVICSHTLEDIRDPLWVCSEMVRIAKRGYIEVPSRVAESCRGWEDPEEAGLSHHRWLITMRDNSIDFLMKYHLIHTHWRFSLPASFLKGLPTEQRVQWMFWEDSFSYRERMARDLAAQIAELETFVESVRPYPRWWLRADSQARKTQHFVNRALNKALRVVNGKVGNPSQA